MKIFKKSRKFKIALVVGLVVVFGPLARTSRAGDCCSSKKSSRPTPERTQDGHDHGSYDPGNHGPQDERASILGNPPHGGQVTRTGVHYFEIVYQPRETRVYIYGPEQRPVSASGVNGQVVMAVRGNPELFRYPIGGATGTTAQAGQEYLSLPVDVSPIRNGDMQVTFHLANLPFRQEPQTQITQTFAISRMTLPVTVAKMNTYDQIDVERQGICPVMNAPLGAHGQPIKLIVGAQPLYVCCDGCIEQVKQNPAQYLTLATTLQNGR